MPSSAFLETPRTLSNHPTIADLETPSLTSARIPAPGFTRGGVGEDMLASESAGLPPESGTMRCITEIYIPRLLRSETMYRLRELFEEEMGCEFELWRVIASFGCARDCFPRRLSGPLLIALSRKLHPDRRVSFFRDACSLLHEYEGDPRVLV